MVSAITAEAAPHGGEMIDNYRKQLFKDAEALRTLFARFFPGWVRVILSPEWTLSLRGGVLTLPCSFYVRTEDNYRYYMLSTDLKSVFQLHPGVRTNTYTVDEGMHPMNFSSMKELVAHTVALLRLHKELP